MSQIMMFPLIDTKKVWVVGVGVALLGLAIIIMFDNKIVAGILGLPGIIVFLFGLQMGKWIEVDSANGRVKKIRSRLYGKETEWQTSFEEIAIVRLRVEKELMPNNFGNEDNFMAQIEGQASDGTKFLFGNAPLIEFSRSSLAGAAAKNAIWTQHLQERRDLAAKLSNILNAQFEEDLSQNKEIEEVIPERP